MVRNKESKLIEKLKRIGRPALVVGTALSLIGGIFLAPRLIRKYNTNATIVDINQYPNLSEKYKNYTNSNNFSLARTDNKEWVIVDKKYDFRKRIKVSEKRQLDVYIDENNQNIITKPIANIWNSLIETIWNTRNSNQPRYTYLYPNLENNPVKPINYVEINPYLGIPQENIP